MYCLVTFRPAARHQHRYRTGRRRESDPEATTDNQEASMSAALSIAASNDRMSAADYERERQRIAETYGANSREAGALRDQALARLFHVSGWTQEELAKKEKMTQQRVAQRLVFGRFLENTTDSCNRSNLTEWGFRECWNRTDKSEKNERIRFAKVEQLIAELELKLVKPRNTHLTKLLLKRFGDGREHALATMVKASGAPEAEVVNTLGYFGRTRNGYGVVEYEKRTDEDGAVFYRFQRGSGKRIAMATLMQELGPIIKELEIQGTKNAATASPTTVAIMTHKLKQILDRLAK
jgi:hypothetical protein